MNASENQSLSFHGHTFGAPSRRPWRTDGRAAGPEASEVKRRRLAGVRCPARRHAPSGRHGPRTRAAQRGGGRRVWKKFLCIFWKTDSEKFVCRISVSPRGPPKIGAHPPWRKARRARLARNPTPATLPPPPLRGPLPGARARRGACGAERAARSAQASAHPRYAAPSLVRGRRTDARSALPDGPRAVRGACGAAHPGVSPPPLRCPLPGARAADGRA
jgi:hypothetical protein